MGLYPEGLITRGGGVISGSLRKSSLGSLKVFLIQILPSRPGFSSLGKIIVKLERGRGGKREKERAREGERGRRREQEGGRGRRRELERGKEKERETTKSYNFN